MAPRRIFIDKTEVVFMVPSKSKVVRQCLSAKEIVRIQFDKFRRGILGIFKKESEMITIVSGKLAAPIVYKKHQNKKYFNEYKCGLEKFSKDNLVTLVDNLKEKG